MVEIEAIGLCAYRIAAVPATNGVAKEVPSTLQ